MKHTKGPWIAQDEYEGIIPVDAPISSTGNDESIEICSVSNQDVESMIANANLIAAAPDLLESLEGLHGALSRMIDKHDPDSIEAEWLTYSHEAISKAKGK